MAEIALMVCAVSSLAASVGGGFYFLKQEEKKAKEEERLEEIEAQVEDSTKFVVYTQCDYKGDPFQMGHDGEGGVIESHNPKIRGLIIPVGFKVDTYSLPDKGGVKISYGGPSKVKCISVPYLEWRKE
jgi:hypothetical protein